MMRNKMVLFSEMVTSAAAPQRLYPSTSFGLEGSKPTQLSRNHLALQVKQPHVRDA